VRDETVALHGGYEGGPARAVAVPTHKRVAHDFENATHAGAVFDLDQAGPLQQGK
jgi:O-acetylhomoserine/O-acetylserine sulfhydrylase-like pyridoxal-dependent enzyme